MARLWHITANAENNFFRCSCVDIEHFANSLILQYDERSATEV